MEIFDDVIKVFLKSLGLHFGDSFLDLWELNLLKAVDLYSRVNVDVNAIFGWELEGA